MESLYDKCKLSMRTAEKQPTISSGKMKLLGKTSQQLDSKFHNEIMSLIKAWMSSWADFCHSCLFWFEPNWGIRNTLSWSSLWEWAIAPSFGGSKGQCEAEEDIFGSSLDKKFLISSQRLPGTPCQGQAFVAKLCLISWYLPWGQ